MKKSVVLSFIILILFPLTSYGEGPLEHFNSDFILTESISDIGKMSPEEIEVFLSYFASCEAAGGDLKEFHCDRDREIFLIKYGRGRAIDRIVRALNVEWMWFRAADKVAKLNSKENEEMFKAVARYTDITRKLRAAANRRCRSLFSK